MWRNLGKWKYCLPSLFIFLVACQSQSPWRNDDCVRRQQKQRQQPFRRLCAEVKPDYSLYDGIISKYATVNENSKGDGSIDNTIAYLLRNEEIYTGIDYALYDLDKNGHRWTHYFVYTSKRESYSTGYLYSDGQVIRLTSPEVKLASIGNVLLDTLVDGSL